jgi:hypothetical protein
MLMPRDPLHRLLFINGLCGAFLALAFVAALFIFNVAGLADLLGSEGQPALVVGLMAFGFIITFSSLMMGSAIMMQSDRDDDHGDGDSGHGARTPRPLRPAMAKASAAKSSARKLIALSD